MKQRKWMGWTLAAWIGMSGLVGLSSNTVQADEIPLTQTVTSYGTTYDNHQKFQQPSIIMWWHLQGLYMAIEHWKKQIVLYNLSQRNRQQTQRIGPDTFMRIVDLMEHDF
jgi:hypothetical protein